jgi:hypothetical protein
MESGSPSAEISFSLSNFRSGSPLDSTSAIPDPVRVMQEVTWETRIALSPMAAGRPKRLGLQSSLDLTLGKQSICALSADAFSSEPPTPDLKSHKGSSRTLSQAWTTA